MFLHGDAQPLSQIHCCVLRINIVLSKRLLKKSTFPENVFHRGETKKDLYNDETTATHNDRPH